MIAGYRPGDALATIDNMTEVVSLALSFDPLFIRYSEGPDRDCEGPSTDYESGLRLPGLSVTSITPPTWWTRPPVEWVARRMCKYAGLMEAPRRPKPWLLAGQVVGTGPDHEPLVAAVSPIAWIGPAALSTARRIYQERFVSGRDSRSLPARVLH